MPLLAHSARPEDGIPVQLYSEHVQAVYYGAAERAGRAAAYSPRFGTVLRAAVEHAAVWHDLGKLESANQAVLASSSRNPLPLNHCDAGVARLLQEAANNPARAVAAVLVYAHHVGLPA